MAAKVEIYQTFPWPSETGRLEKTYRWRLRAANSQIVATGHQSFVSRSNARRAALNVAYLMRDFLIIDVEDA